MDFKDLTAKRRSTRRFLPRKVERDTLKRILDTALAAPSSRNSHSSRFIVTSDADDLGCIAQMRDYGTAFVKDAPAAILVLGDTEKTDLWKVNAAISATMLQLAAVDEGLASCWVHVEGRPRLKSQPEGEQAEDVLRTRFDIPSHWRVLCAVAIGYADYTPAPLPPYDSSNDVIWR